MEKAWNRVMTGLWDPGTGCIYDYISSNRFGEVSYKACMATPEEMALQFPNPNGWRIGLEDCDLKGGPMLVAAIRRLEAHGGKDAVARETLDRVYRGLRNCATISGIPGFVARGVSPIDGKSFYINSSRDQYTLFVYSMWRYYRSGLADDARKAEIRTMLVDIAKMLNRIMTDPKARMSLPRADGKPGDIGYMWVKDPHRIVPIPEDTHYVYFDNLMNSHEAFRLPMFYAAAWDVSGDPQWRTEQLKYMDDAFFMTGPRFVPYGFDLPSFALYQAQVSHRLLYELEPDAATKAKLADVMRRFAKMADRTFDDVEKRLEKITDAELYGPVADWRGRPFYYRSGRNGGQPPGELISGLPYMIPNTPDYWAPQQIPEHLGLSLLSRLMVPGEGALPAPEIARFRRIAASVDWSRHCMSSMCEMLLAYWALEGHPKERIRSLDSSAAGLRHADFGISTNGFPAWVEPAIRKTHARYLAWKGSDTTVVIPIMTDEHTPTITVTKLPVPQIYRNHTYYQFRAAEIFDADLFGNLGDLQFDQTPDWKRASPEHSQRRLEVERDLYRGLKVPFFFCKGNHDGGTKGFEVTPALFGEKLNGLALEAGHRPTLGPGKDWGKYDLGAKKCRVLFLDSCERGYWGYSDAQIAFVASEFRSLPKDWCAIVFTHKCPNEHFGYFRTGEGCERIYNEAKLRGLMEKFVAEGGRLAGCVCGDSHFNATGLDHGVNYFVCQGFGGAGGDKSGVIRKSPDPVRLNANYTYFKWHRETLLDVVAIKPATGDMAVFRIGACDTDRFSRKAPRFRATGPLEKKDLALGDATDVGALAILNGKAYAFGTNVVAALARDGAVWVREKGAKKAKKFDPSAPEAQRWTTVPMPTGASDLVVAKPDEAWFRGSRISAADFPEGVTAIATEGETVIGYSPRARAILRFGE